VTNSLREADEIIRVPPSGGSLEIGNKQHPGKILGVGGWGSPFGGIPRNWKQ